MKKIEIVKEGSLAKNSKLNEVIKVINSLLNMTVRQGSANESPKLTVGDTNSEMVTTGSAGGGSFETFTLNVVKDDNTAGTADFYGDGVND